MIFEDVKFIDLGGLAIDLASTVFAEVFENESHSNGYAFIFVAGENPGKIDDFFFSESLSIGQKVVIRSSW